MANAFRVQAYRRRAETVARLDRPVSEILEQEGLDALRKLLGIGERLTIAIRDIVVFGRLPTLARLRGESDPEELLRTVSGVGHIRARRLHEELGIDFLEDLEAAAHDGRLANIEGLGPKCITAIQDSLAARLGRFRTAPAGALSEPNVEELLDVDREYNRRQALGELHKIAPRPFNPQGDAWLPILHTQRGERHYTALFSNTAMRTRSGKLAIG
jgi:DNA polymerase (family 10)